MDASRSRPDGPSSSEEISARLFCCRFMRRWVPLAYREELYHILRMTGPLLASRILNYLHPFVVTIFCGRLGNSALAGYAMACAFINVTSASICLGLCFACDTLVSQTFGGGKLLRVGVILQKSILILMVFCLASWGVLVNTEAFLLLLGQDAEVARIAQVYSMAYLPAIPALALHQLQMSYLQNQGMIMPLVYAAFLANIANLLTNFFLFWLDFGVPGSAAANSLSIIYNCGFLFLYIRCRNLHAKSWGGWTTECLQDWSSYMKLAIPSAMMCCFEWWIYEIGGFLAGMISEEDLGAQHVVIMLAYVNYMIPLGVQVVACVRVGNALGAGDTDGAIFTSKVVLTFTAVLAVLQAIVLGAPKRVIAYIFTSDENIAELVSELMSVYIVLQLCNGIFCVSMGILLGTGQQKIAAIANPIGYYCIGLPIIIALMFVTDLQVMGFWIGLLISTFLLAVFYIIMIFKMNWKRLTKEAIARAGNTVAVPLMSPASESDPSRSTASSNETSVNGHGGLACQAQEGTVQPTALLSNSQLIIRRGLVLLAAVLTLFVGTVLHLLLPLPEPFGGRRMNETMDFGNWSTATPLAQSTLPTL
ncbi:multidrug and toxin extrusion protein 1-like [Denticeps clupeoides]|uniref:Multidrug and toxin extrusion protein n=1 Tax=Denticeps clupeoides TaxID=299321 RepID=A0AAY4DRF3_9TELE|nr:multidrug and toxin extrusion protein 1-like [Denticeps clupeoides]